MQEETNSAGNVFLYTYICK